MADEPGFLGARMAGNCCIKRSSNLLWNASTATHSIFSNPKHNIINLPHQQSQFPPHSIKMLHQSIAVALALGLGASAFPNLTGRVTVTVTHTDIIPKIFTSIATITETAPCGTVSVDLPTGSLSVSHGHLGFGNKPTHNFPGFDLPSASLPGFDFPSATLPSASLPTDQVPSVTLPSASLPTDQDPSATLPSASVPTFDVPSFSLPAFSHHGFGKPTKSASAPAASASSKICLNFDAEKSQIMANVAAEQAAKKPIPQFQQGQYAAVTANTSAQTTELDLIHGTASTKLTPFQLGYLSVFTGIGTDQGVDC